MAACVAGCGSCRRQISRTAMGSASRMRPVDDAVTSVLRDGALCGDPDAAAGHDDRQPVVDVLDVLDRGLGIGRPEIEGGGAGATVEQQRPGSGLVQADRAAPGPGIVRGQRAVPPFPADDGAVEASFVERGTNHREVTQALGEPAGRGVGPDQLEFDVRVQLRPAALEVRGVPAHGRPGMSDPQPGVTGGGGDHQVVGLGQQVPGPGDHLNPGRGGCDAPAGAVQQPAAEDLLQRDQRAGDGRLRDVQLDGGVGEAAGVDDGDQAPQVAQLQFHNFSV